MFATKPIIFHLLQKYFLRPLLYQRETPDMLHFSLYRSFSKHIPATELCLEYYYRVSKNINVGGGKKNNFVQGMIYQTKYVTRKSKNKKQIWMYGNLKHQHKKHYKLSQKTSKGWKFLNKDLLVTCKGLL